MAPEISRREVLNNLIRFKDSLLEKPPNRLGLKEREYKVLLNRKTGDMRFPQKIKSLEYQINRKKGRSEAPGDWKEVRIIVTENHFEVRDIKNQKLEPTQFEPLAWRVTRETLEVLNARAEEAAEFGLLAEEAALKDLSAIHLSKPVEEIEDLPGWVGNQSRIEVEKRLSGKALGTYVLREGDSLICAISFHLSEENHLQLFPFLLTVVEDEEKISDYLLIKTSFGWTLYRDDPHLNDRSLYHYQPTPHSLLREMSGLAKQPIPRGVF